MDGEYIIVLLAMALLLRGLIEWRLHQRRRRRREQMRHVIGIEEWWGRR